MHGIRLQSAAERTLDEVVYVFRSFCGRSAVCVRWDPDLGPNDQMGDVFGQSVWPVVPKYAIALGLDKWHI